MTEKGELLDDAEESDGYGCVILFGLAIVAIGFFVLYSGGQSTLLTAKAQYWVETPCRILTARLDRSLDEKSDHTYRYRADFTYAYEFDEKRYVGTREAAFVTYNRVDVASDRLDVFPVGSQTVCYVNPNDPSDAVLNNSFEFGPAILFTFFGLGTVSAGIWIVFASIKKSLAG